MNLMTSEHSTPNSTLGDKTISDILSEALRKEEVQTALREACRGKAPEQVAQEATMAVPMLLALTICPALLGTQEAIRQSQSKNKREEHRARRCNLVVSCVKQSIRSRDIDGKLVLWITTTSLALHDENPEPTDDGYPFSGYFLPYPGTSYEGLVSTISDDPPMLNWIYVDKNTYEVKYGLRTDAQEHLTGPFDCTRQDRRMTLEDWEGFVAVEDYPGVWALYFDRDDDGLVTKVPMGTRVLEVELTRREKKERKPEPDPNQAQTLDEMMKQHTEQSERQEEETNGFLQDEGQDQQSGQPESATQESADHLIDPGSDELSNSSIGIGKLSLDDDAVVHVQEQPIRTVPRAASSSANSDNFSFWSTEKKTDEIGEATSVAATSIDIDDSSDIIPQGHQESQYRRPYVEDSLGYEPVD
ncbi:hypothetical protein FHL15_010879 [Xylaria flabelliformis]|uniref:Uncharacterized protein n=1 Tax=Xylaria flabelliformis TaxID=2512241 RepID=A0A553HJX9_9PEZI|nr:hypothetical protein FHL15_010879 [Xylaria flabelliformis]